MKNYSNSQLFKVVYIRRTYRSQRVPTVSSQWVINEGRWTDISEKEEDGRRGSGGTVGVRV